MNQAVIQAWGDQPPLFVQLLSAEVARGNKTEAAKRIGMSRTAVSLLLANRYSSPSTARIESRILSVLGRLECVALGEVVTAVQCQSYREKPAPTHNPTAMQSWRDCQFCKHNPICKGTKQ